MKKASFLFLIFLINFFSPSCFVYAKTINSNNLIKQNTSEFLSNDTNSVEDTEITKRISNEVQNAILNEEISYKEYNVIKRIAKDNANTYFLITDDKGYGVATKRGKLIIPCEYSKIVVHHVFVVEKKDKNDKKHYGAYSFEGDLVIPVIYDSLKINSFDRSTVVKDDRTSVLSLKGEKIMPLTKCENFLYLSENRFLYSQGKKHYLYNSEKQKADRLPYENVTRLINKLLVENNGKKGLYDYDKEKITIPLKYDEIKIYKSDYLVCLNGRYGLLSNAGKEICKTEYINIQSIDFNILALEKLNGKYNLAANSSTGIGIIDFDLDEIPNRELCQKTNEAFIFPCKVNGKYGIVSFDFNRFEQKILLPFEYDKIDDYQSCCISTKPWKFKRYYRALKNGKYGLVDAETMVPVTDFIYDEFQRLYDDKFKVKKDGKYAFYNIKKNKFGKFKYDDIRIGKFETEWTGKNTQVNKNGKWYYNNKGKIIGTCAGYAVFYTAAAASAPVTVPATFAFIALLYYGCSEPHYKLPKTINVIHNN